MIEAVVCTAIGLFVGWHLKGAYTRNLRGRIERMQRRLRGL